MTWDCRLIAYSKEKNMKTLSVGDMFYFDPPPSFENGLGDPHGWGWISWYATHSVLSDHYKLHNSARKPLLVFMPSRTLFCVDAMQLNKGERYGGWQVTGVEPNITLASSIHLDRQYHGYIQNGIISDDLDGRTYNEYGSLIT